MIQSYKQLFVWQKSKQLVVIIYKLTENFPKEEMFGLTSQMRRCAVSIPSNIAEGRMRGTKKDFLSFLRISYGSGAELETQIEIAKEVFKDKNLDYSQADSLLEETMKMLNAMLRKMNPHLPNTNEAKEAIS
jgi:four helix bundle protein